MIFVAVEGTFVRFTKGHDHFFQILFGAIFYGKTNVTSRAEIHWRLAVATLRGGNELRLLIYAVRVCRFPPLFPIMFLELCVQRSGTICRTQGVVLIRFKALRFHALADIRLVTISACALYFINYNNR